MLFRSGYRAFKDAQIEGLSLNDGLVEIEDEAFSYNYIPNLVVPATVKMIGKRAFSNCNIKELTFLTSSPTVTTHHQLRCLHSGIGIIAIGDKAFINNQIHHRITFPNTLQYLNSKAFFNNDIPPVTLGKRVKKVGDYAFMDNCVTDVTISNTEDLEYMGHMAMGRDIDNLQINFADID